MENKERIKAKLVLAKSILAQVATPATPPAAMPPAMPTAGPPGPGMGAPAPAPPPGGAQPPGGGQPQQREQQVRAVIDQLRQSIVELGKTIYEIPLTDFQVSDIAERMLETFSESVNDITVDRVKEIGMGMIGGDGTRQRRKQ